MTGKGKKLNSLERRYQRASCDFPSEFTWGTVTHRGAAKVISLGGCYLATEVIVPCFEEVELTFAMDPQAPPLRCHGKVVWLSEQGIKVRTGRRERGFALEFKRIYPEDRARVDEYVKRQTRLFRAIEHEFKKARPDKDLIKDVFGLACPGESTHLGHIHKRCREETRYFRLRV
ncbi:MAG TPA: PilZ domain-containing protein [bacterium]|nr:PilZ domain-containing protein [bacterium]